MGRDHRGAALMRGRAALLGALLLLALVGPVAAPSYAADPTPTPDPTQLSTQLSTPSLSPPSEQQIKDARDALDRLRNQGKPASAPPTTTLAEVAGPTSGNKSGSVTSRISDQGWWTIGAGLLVLLVLSETTRLSVRRAKHRRRA
jgi:hypothetical protein